MANPSPQPTIETERLRLRPFRMSDARRVQTLVGEREIAATTLNIPHPYQDGMAETWIRTHEPGYAADELATFAITIRASGELVGAIGLVIDRDHGRAELGYWIGRPYWNHGYATEAARALLRLGFEQLGVHRIQAEHLVRNPASGRVMQKAGMRHEGRLRHHILKWGVYEDIDVYGILADELPASHVSEGA